MLVTGPLCHSGLEEKGCGEMRNGADDPREERGVMGGAGADLLWFSCQAHIAT